MSRLHPGVVAKLKALRGLGESYSDVIPMLAKGGGGGNECAGPRVIASLGGIVGTRKLRWPRVSVKSSELQFCERKQAFAYEGINWKMIDNEII
jgi:hypothetical protein